MAVLSSQMPTQMMANAIRALAMDSVEAAKSGHPGMPMGMADAATILFTRHLKFDPQNPDWPDRDRFILSAGHGSMLIYSLLYLTGYKDVTLEDLRQFRQLNSPAAGHPEYGHFAGIETTTGPLGQGIANGVGMAMAETHLRAKFGDTLVDHHTYVIAGDGCLMEGISHESASLAGHLGLGKLILLFDDNSISIDGPTDMSTGDDITARFTAYGWQVLSCDGHDMNGVDQALFAARADENKPTLIRCRTIIGKGAPNIGGTAKAHGAPLGETEIALARQTMNWPFPPFEIPDDILAAWRKAGSQHENTYKEWSKTLHSSPLHQDFEADISGDLDNQAAKAIHHFKASLAGEPQKLASRVASQKSIEVLMTQISNLFGGSADLTPSNNTKTAAHTVFSKTNPAGNYVHYGVREHAMAAAMNGIALHKGLVPYGGTFLIFTDYCRPAIRLSALMKQRVIYVMTHDSIGLGEDGPTHQPVEHLAALRVIPNLNLFRPADIVETAEAWQIALSTKHTPSVLALSRQGLPQHRLGDDIAENKSMRGGYILAEASAPAQIVLIASGSEVAIAADARISLEADGHPTRLISVPCLDLLLEQDEHYRGDLLGTAKSIVVIEAGMEMGWSAFAGSHARFVGMTGFGASAPGADLYHHFGITWQAVKDSAITGLG